MRIEQLQHFLEVAKCNSLSQAAENLFIGKSTLSNSISSLENGRYNPSIMLAHNIARYFGMTIEEVFIFEEE